MSMKSEIQDELEEKIRRDKGNELLKLLTEAKNRQLELEADMPMHFRED